ncbi:protein phosphatase 1 regulatory subunit 12A isoform X3 [Daktulosphaira vitifoliae]|uniref:protein phosphatase 1 regulatory subunit 12A isoform X3 n=1 Tax=Daktulosphaira vitifoliae TaxID=58002 RepID=UPI0021AAED8B|nr:protein phosphatase 1 regulatory subunit 12A isoform X3 [Daktulosphaira vitifoliae]
MSALFKRAEQLKRWEESDTNRESPVRKNIKAVSFPIDCAFLASVASGDKNEVNSLLYLTADINAANADGLTALHQACIDDNLDMVEFLVEHGADVNRGDKEGWTPLHATASCGFLSIAKYLLEHGADVSAINCDQELAIDIAESDEMRQLLQQYLKEAGIDCDDARNKEERLMLRDAREWINTKKFKDSPHPTTGAMAIHVAAAKGYIKVIELLIQAGADINCQDYDGWTPLHAAAYWGQKEACEILVEHFCDMKKKNFVGQTAFDVCDEDIKDLLDELKKKQASQNSDVSDKNYLINNKLSNTQKRSRLSGNDKQTLKKDKEIVLVQNRIIQEEEDETKLQDNLPKSNKVEIELTPLEQCKPEINNANSTKDNKYSTLLENNELKPPEIVLRRTQSFESDEKFYRRYCELRAKIKGNLWGVIHSSPTTSTSPPMRTASLKEKPQSRRNKSNFRDEQTNLSPVPNISSDSSQPACSQQNIRSGVKAFISGLQMQQKQAETTHKIVPGNIFKNFFKSFVPPVRDDESETQRKAHAKRVRETRRSTQGVTLEELKTAEQIVKQKNQDIGKSKLINSTHIETNNNSTNKVVQPQAKTEEHITVTATITPLARNISSNISDNSVERRPSWRLRVENGSKFLLEDVRSNEPTSKMSNQSAHIPSTVEASTDTTVTLPLRSSSFKSEEDNEQDKENDCRNHQTTQAVIQRRKRPKRRSTGVVHVDLDEIDPDRQDTSSCGGTDESIGEVSGGDNKISHTSRLGSVSSQDNKLGSSATSPVSCIENGEIDYKALYEEVVVDNERLRRQLQKTEEDLLEAKITIEKQSTNTSKNTLSEIEKRERRAMERKLSEMEEELKQLQKLKAENERLRTENRALTRVVSKLTHT